MFNQAGEFPSAGKPMPEPKKKKYRVFVSQVSRQVIEVDAVNEDEAREEGYRKWRKEYAHSYVEAVEQDQSA